MLAEEEEVGGELAGEAIVGEAALELQGVTVGDGAEIEDGERVRGQGSGIRGEETPESLRCG